MAAFFWMVLLGIVGALYWAAGSHDPRRRQRPFAVAQFEQWLGSSGAAQHLIEPDEVDIVLESETFDRKGKIYTLTRFLRNREGRYVMFKSTPSGPYVKLVADDVAKVVLKRRYRAPSTGAGQAP